MGLLGVPMSILIQREKLTRRAGLLIIVTVIFVILGLLGL